MRRQMTVGFWLVFFLQIALLTESASCDDVVVGDDQLQITLSYGPQGLHEREFSIHGTKLAGRYRLRPGDRIRASHVEMAFDPPLAAGQTVVFEAARAADVTVAGGMLTSLKELRSEPSPASARWHTPMQALIRAGRELVASRPLAAL